MSDTISFTSSQNVQLTYQTASLGDRILAYLLDGFVKIGFILLMILIFSPVFDKVEDFAGIWVIILLFSPIVFYSLFFEYFFQGQSPGKKALEIKVVTLEGQSANLSQYLTRWIFRLVDFQLMSGLVALVAVAASNKGQRIGDIVAGTSVISLKRRKNLRQTAFMKTESEYEPIYLEATNLSKKDIQIIKEILADRSERRFELITRLASKIAEVLHIQKQGSSESFLKTIIKDYNYLKSRDF
jgi:uncharacterized RDD family membrane protein YckC